MNIKALYQSKRWAFRTIFLGEDEKLHAAGQAALAHLRIFCNATKSKFSSDPLQLARMAGREEVLIEIMTFINYDYSQLYDLEETSDND
jgi:hypothetical protein